MIRYFLFTGMHYYPSGGWEDYKDSYLTLEGALKATIGCKEDWWHIVEIDDIGYPTIVKKGSK